MTTLRDIFVQADEAEVLATVARLYDCKKEWLPEAIANMLAKLRQLVPDTGAVASELHIEPGEPLLPDDPPGWDVWIRSAGEPDERYSFSLSRWEEWLALAVPEPLRAQMPAAEIAAHCIWDMTFHGWTQEQIAEERAELDRRGREIDEGNVEMIPWEEVKTRLDATIEEARKKRAQP
jgi:hypothetical protein